MARLQQIVAAEGVEAEPAALAILARRAAGSMRDSQSLLEQLLAFGGERITAADVHGMLGTAGEARLAALVDAPGRAQSGGGDRPTWTPRWPRAWKSGNCSNNSSATFATCMVALRRLPGRRIAAHFAGRP